VKKRKKPIKKTLSKILSGTLSFFQNPDETQSKNRRCATATDVRCWPSFPPLVYISNIEYFVTLKSCLRILFLSQGTNAVWGFNFLRVGGVKPFKLLECILVGEKKGKLFCNFSPVGSFCVNCKCACLCAIACYKLCRPCFILSGGWRKCVKPSYNLYGVKNNFTNARYNFTGAYYNFTNARCKLTNARYNYAGGHYINNVADFIKCGTRVITS